MSGNGLPRVPLVDLRVAVAATPMTKPRPIPVVTLARELLETARAVVLGKKPAVTTSRTAKTSTAPVATRSVLVSERFTP